MLLQLAEAGVTVLQSVLEVKGLEVVVSVPEYSVFMAAAPTVGAAIFIV
jgi:hypothetical protein